MNTKFFTNKERDTLLEKFEGLFAHNPNIRFFDALVGYFRASGYFKIRPFLNKVPKVRILAGINVDKLLSDAQKSGLEFFKSHDKTKSEFIKDILKDIENADYDEETEKGILQFIQDLIDKKIEVKAHPEKKIHAKVYVFYDDIHNQHNKQCSVITGSSNLTDSGLGATKNNNYEFNVELSDYDDVKFAYDEFEELWKDAIDILPVDAEAIMKKSYLKEDSSPFELYIKMLIEYFGNRVEYDPYNIELLLPEKYIRLKYQTDAANQGYSMMMKHNGFILADVVGLGKTVIAAMIIKKFIYENGSQTRILIVCPPAIKPNWVRTSEDFQIRNHFTFVTTGSLHKVLDAEHYEIPDADSYDLIIVDESHKFRNDYTSMYLALQEICKKPRLRPGENGDTRKKIILISATPLNNRPQDIENQLYLFQDKRNSTLETVKNLQEYFKPVNEKYIKLSAEVNLNIPKLKELFNQLRNDVVEPLVIRRTRRDISNNPEYLEDLKNQKMEFPEVDDPEAMHYTLDVDLTQLFLDTVDLIAGVDEFGNPLAGSIGYYRYRAIEFLKKDEDRKIYGNVGSISDRLAAIMRTLMVKRLESSFKAFNTSLKRFQRACENMLGMIDDNRIFIAPDLDVNKMLEEGFSYDQIQDKIENKGGNNKEFKAAAFTNDFIDNLKEDKRKIDKLVKQWDKVTSDPKLEKFIDGLKNEFFKKKKNYSGKLVIFTEAKDTAHELEEKMKSSGFGKILCVSSENRKAAESIIRNNFDANLEEELWQNDYDILITTEVLAEGVNLHRSNMIVNYDVPWNSTRLMQRIGRVNRIGSRAKKIYVYNYYPSAEGNQQIRLVQTALRKLQAFHTAFGEDNRIFSLLEEVGDGALYGSKIKQEESELLKYLIELREFRKQHPKRFRELAKMPNKSRVGRDTANVLAQDIPMVDESGLRLNIQTSSVCYLKADNHPGIFCVVTDVMNVREVGFLDAVRLFKAPEAEKAIVIHNKHFIQAQTAFTFFKTEVVQKNLSSINRQSLSPAENKALTYLREANKLVPTAQKKQVLKQVTENIKSGAYNSKGLPKQINDFFSANMSLFTGNTNVFFEKLFKELLDRFNSSNTNDDELNRTNSSIINPKIVLTVSFK